MQNRKFVHKNKAPLCKGSWRGEAVTEGLFPRKTYFLTVESAFLERCKIERWRTKVSLHLLEGEGDRVAVEGVNTARKHTLTPLRSSISNSETKNEQCTSASPPLVREGGPRSGGWD